MVGELFRFTSVYECGEIGQIINAANYKFLVSVGELYTGTITFKFLLDRRESAFHHSSEQGVWT